jgi:tetratricopeptide (TPR) repeat protein
MPRSLSVARLPSLGLLLSLAVVVPGVGRFGSVAAQPAPPPVAATPADARADSLMARGDYAGAAAAYQRIAAANPSSARAWMRLGVAHTRLGDHAAAADAFEHAASVRPSAVSLYNAALARGRLGQRERAFALLGRAAATGAVTADYLAGDSALASFRDDARFRAVLDSAARASTPCARDPDARRFDFWLGEWDVRTPQGQLAGRSSIVAVSGECALLENWTSAFGTSGKSLNGYNPALGRWQQFWIGQDRTVTEYRDSAWDGPSLVFLAAAAPSDTTHTTQRLTFTPLSKDLVRQHGERSTDDGRSWTTTYDLYYYRR